MTARPHQPTLGELFPLGGPVPPDLVIGRAGEIEDIGNRLREGLSTMLIGPRRVGKTTVCEAVCHGLRQEGIAVYEIEVPERTDSQAFLQLLIDRCTRMSLHDEGRALLRMFRPALEKWLRDEGVPLDLGELVDAGEELPIRTILSLPLELTRRSGQRGVLFLDELQRAMSYADGHAVLTDLVDLYGASQDVVVLVDGSDERTLNGMLGKPVHFGKLVDRQTLAATIPETTWREPLRDRFARAGLELPKEQLQKMLRWSGGAPYPTMAVARYTAFNARRVDPNASQITAFDFEMGLDEAQRHLEDDGA